MKKIKIKQLQYFSKNALKKVTENAHVLKLRKWTWKKRKAKSKTKTQANTVFMKFTIEPEWEKKYKEPVLVRSLLYW